MKHDIKINIWGCISANHGLFLDHGVGNLYLINIVMKQLRYRNIVTTQMAYNRTSTKGSQSDSNKVNMMATAEQVLSYLGTRLYLLNHLSCRNIQSPSGNNLRILGIIWVVMMFLYRRYFIMLFTKYRLPTPCSKNNPWFGLKQPKILILISCFTASVMHIRLYRSLSTLQYLLLRLNLITNRDSSDQSNLLQSSKAMFWCALHHSSLRLI